MAEPTPSTMIEDYIPVDAISAESVREKLGGHHISKGMPRNLHLWWARRPLAASRAAVYATFAPPAVGEARSELAKFFTSLCHWTGPVLPDRPEILAARELVSKAAGGKRPRVLDMFAGGGAIPLEAQRLGADAIALDLNPVAHLIQLCTLVYPQKYGQRLRDAVERWGTKVIDATRAEVGDLYPDITPSDSTAKKGTTAGLFDKKVTARALRPIAYLWTRTIPSPARGFEKGAVPLVRQTWLRRKSGAYVAARPVVDRKALTVTWEIVESSAKTEKAAIAEWKFDPAGLSTRGATTCPFSGAPVTAADVKAAGLAGTLSHALMAVVCVDEGKRGKRYLPASALPDTVRNLDSLGVRVAQHAPLTVPTEALPERLTGGMCTSYGLDRYDKLFNPRQQLVLLTLCKHVRAAFEALVAETDDREFSVAVASYLGLLVGRVADRGSVLCRWNGLGEKTEATYSRQALPMLWDYSEASPFGGASGDAGLQLEYILDVIDHVGASAPDRPAEVIRGRAQKLPLDDASVDAVITDPPYYDNISYADLSDFFYVWHKRALAAVHPSLYATDVTPKKAEAIAAVQRHDGDHAAAARFYEDQMQLAFAEAHRVLKAGAPMLVVYAHKTTLGWSTLVDSLRRAGFQVTEAWPLNTEKPDRVGQMNTASLASSIFLVARKRAVAAGVGNYATEVRPAMARVVEARVKELMAVGVTGADLVIACVGAGLRPYTRFDRVELPNGEELPAARFLDEVQREALESILAAVFHIDRAGVGQVDRASRFYILARYQYGAVAVEFDELNVLAKGLGIELSGAGSLSDGRDAMVKVDKGEATLRDYSERGKAEGLGIAGAAPAPLIDVLHRALWLMENDRAKLGPFLDSARVDPGRLRLLADALKGRALSGEGAAERTQEQRAVDQLLAQWSRVVEARTMPLLAEAKTGG